MLKTEIELYKSSDVSKGKELIIDYFVYENDKSDPGKKIEKAKLYVGYIRVDSFVSLEKLDRDKNSSNFHTKGWHKNLFN